MVGTPAPLDPALADQTGSAWLGARNALLRALADAGFPVDASDLYTPELFVAPESPVVTVGFSEEAYQVEEEGQNFEDSISFTVAVHGRAEDNAGGDRLVALTESLFRFLQADAEGDPRELEDEWLLADATLYRLYSRQDTQEQNRRWCGIVKVYARRLR